MSEYSTDALEVQKNLVKSGGVDVIIDDLPATGGTMEAAIKGIEMCGAKVGLVLVVIELSDLGAESSREMPGEYDGSHPGWG